MEGEDLLRRVSEVARAKRNSVVLLSGICVAEMPNSFDDLCREVEELSGDFRTAWRDYMRHRNEHGCSENWRRALD